MKNYRFKTATACEIARVDRGVLNEMIAKGAYTAAAETTKGAVRYFDNIRMIYLIIFGQLIKLGLPAPVAAERASALYNETSGKALDEGLLVMVRGFNGAVHYLTYGEGESVPTYISGPGEVPTQLTFNLAAIRRYIEKMGEYELNNPIVGED